MPKIINSLKERIKEEATLLFCQSGFEKVDMKRIAKACDIAVGTLYNYYPNKRELYISIVMESWDNTFDKMAGVEVDKDDVEGYLREIISILYEDIIDRQGIGADVAAVSKNGKSEFPEVKDAFMKKISFMLSRIDLSDKYSNYNIIKDKLANMILANTVVLISIDKQNDQENKKENLDILVDSIKEYYK